MNGLRKVPSARLIATLAGAGALAGLLIVLAFQWTQPRILAHRAAVLQAAIKEVLGAPQRTATLFEYDGALTAVPPAGIDTTTLSRIFVGYDARGTMTGFAILAAEPGFADVISLMYGYDPAAKQVIGMKVLDHRETPGLGDRIVKDSAFVAEFRRVTAPLRGVKSGAARKGASDVHLVTGATISSRTVINIINRSLERTEPLIAAYLRGGGR
jgi:electron transport complex protein RnfG